MTYEVILFFILHLMANQIQSIDQSINLFAKQQAASETDIQGHPKSLIMQTAAYEITI